MNYWVAIYRFAWGLLILLVVFGIVCVFLPRSHELRHYQRQRLKLEAENRELERDIHELADNQSRFQTDPAFVERTAREAGMIRTNEVVYRLAEEPENP